MKNDETFDELTFNAWSKSRIRKGLKILTSRRKRYVDDEQVDYIVGPLPWEFIRDFLYTSEGAVSPEELQNIINQIFRRKVEDREEFYVHVLNIPKVLERRKCHNV